MIKYAKIEIRDSNWSNFDLSNKGKLSYSPGITQGMKHIDVRVLLDGVCILDTDVDSKINSIIYPEKQNFIDYFVQEYNKGNILKQIPVEIKETVSYQYNLLKKL